MDNTQDYIQPLFILAFDHRATFYKHLFKVPQEQITPIQHAKITELKNIIFAGVVEALKIIPPQEAAILVDEQYGDQVLCKAKQMGLRFALSTEKSGQREFAFEYGDKFGEHIEKYQPTFAKALIHYNPEDAHDLKQRQQAELKKISDYCRLHKYKFLLEVLIDATEEQLKRVNNNKELYDSDIRPNLATKMIEELQNAEVEPDVWKLEGMENQADYESAITYICAGDRKNVGLVILGRGATDEKLVKWLQAGAKTPGVIGFAVGRTIFWDAIVSLHSGIFSKEQAIAQISQKFISFYQIFRQK